MTGEVGFVRLSCNLWNTFDGGAFEDANVVTQLEVHTPVIVIGPPVSSDGSAWINVICPAGRGWMRAYGLALVNEELMP